MGQEDERSGWLRALVALVLIPWVVAMTTALSVALGARVAHASAGILPRRPMGTILPLRQADYSAEQRLFSLAPLDPGILQEVARDLRAESLWSPPPSSGRASPGGSGLQPR